MCFHVSRETLFFSSEHFLIIINYLYVNFFRKRRRVLVVLLFSVSMYSALYLRKMRRNGNRHRNILVIIVATESVNVFSSIYNHLLLGVFGCSCALQPTLFMLRCGGMFDVFEYVKHSYCDAIPMCFIFMERSVIFGLLLLDINFDVSRETAFIILTVF